MQDTLSLILAEVQSLRADYNTNARETGERLSSLETSMTSLVGNGQPGRITILEQRLDDLRRWRWRMVGIATGVATVLSGIVTTVALLLKG
jgi:hypothetical protein